MSNNEHGTSFRGGEHVLNLDCVDDCTTCEYTKNIELNALNG